MKKTIYFLAFFLIPCSNLLIAQELPALLPSLGVPLPAFDASERQAFQEKRNQWAQVYDKSLEEKLTAEEEKILDAFDEMSYEIFTSVYSLDYPVCSWYEGGFEKISTSSVLASQGKYNYDPNNMIDFDLSTAWVEGVKGNGIGESINIHYERGSPRIRQLTIYNGYVKSPTAWKNNGRVKKLKLYKDGKPIALLELKDERASQTFDLQSLTLGIAYEDEEEEWKAYHLRFEILAVYPGDKYEDVAISEFQFDGDCCCCFAAGSLVSMADGSHKAIERLQEGDTVLSFNFEKQETEAAVVEGLVNPWHQNLHYVVGANDSLLVTADHPFWVEEKGWCAIQPAAAQQYVWDSKVERLEIGDALFHLEKKEMKILSISPFPHRIQTFSITQLSKNQSFFVNGVLVKTEKLQPQH